MEKKKVLRPLGRGYNTFGRALYSKEPLFLHNIYYIIQAINQATRLSTKA
jgi:hypothetical protein